MQKRSALPIVVAVSALLIGALFVHAATNTQVAKKRRTAKVFIVKGEFTRSLRPGVKSQIKVSVANRKYKRIWIKSLRMRVTIDAAHAAAGCSVARDFRIRQLPRKAFPLRLAPAKKARKSRGKKKRKRKAKIRWRAFPAKKANGLPSIEMVNLPGVNQDACKGATLNLKFKGKATSKRPPSRKARG